MSIVFKIGLGKLGLLLEVRITGVEGAAVRSVHTTAGHGSAEHDLLKGLD